jgi:hypothetical protein
VPRDHKQRLSENIDILIGFLGFFAAVLVVTIIASEIRGENAAGWSLTLLGVTLATWGLIKARRRVRGR